MEEEEEDEKRYGDEVMGAVWEKYKAERSKDKKDWKDGVNKMMRSLNEDCHWGAVSSIRINESSSQERVWIA